MKSMIPRMLAMIAKPPQETSHRAARSAIRRRVAMTDWDLFSPAGCTGGIITTPGATSHEAQRFSDEPPGPLNRHSVIQTHFGDLLASGAAPSFFTSSACTLALIGM